MFAIRRKSTQNLLGFRILSNDVDLVDLDRNTNAWTVDNEAMAQNAIANGAIWTRYPTDYFHPRHAFDTSDLEVVKLVVKE